MAFMSLIYFAAINLSAVNFSTILLGRTVSRQTAIYSFNIGLVTYFHFLLDELFPSSISLDKHLKRHIV